MTAAGATRDPRLEFLRGALVAVLLSQLLLGLPALRSLQGPWAGGALAAALARLQLLEGLFVLFLALVAGSVFGRSGREHGLARCSGLLLRRAATYYLACVAVAALVALARLLPRVETAALTQRVDAATGLVGSTYPSVDDRISYQLFELVFLRAGPEQLQVLALCVVLLALAPLVAWGLLRGRGVLNLLLSLALAGRGWLDAQAGAATLGGLGLSYEPRFNLALWQLPFVLAFTLGWYRPRWQAWALRHGAAVLLCASAVAACGLLLATSWLPAAVPAGADVALALAVGLPLLVALHALLGLAWTPLRRSVGRALLPLGQEPLAVFVLHGLWLLLFLQLPPLPAQGAAAALALSWLSTWAIVRTRAGLRWLPH